MRKFLNWKLFLLAVVLVAVFLRFYQLGSIPSGLTNDEANTGYDAYSLVLTGKDQWNHILPINNFVGFGDYPPPVYRYLSLIPILFFGLGEFSVRFISALAGVFSVVATFFFVRNKFNDKAAFFSGLLFAIMPWAIGLSRVAIESNVAILLLILSLYFGITEKQGKKIYLSAFLLGLSVYTYSAYLLFAPIVLFLILFYNYNDKLKGTSLIKFFIIFLIILIPIFISRGSASTRFSQVGLINNINSIGLRDNLNEQRGACLKSFNSFTCKIVNNKPILFASMFFKNYLAHFSPNAIYIDGTATQYSIMQKRGLDYLFSSIFLVFGIYFLLRQNKDRKLTIVLISLFLLSPLPDSLTGDGNYSRSSIMQPFIVILTGIGLYYFFSYLEAFGNKLIKYTVGVLFFFIIIFSTSFFFVTYLTYFKNNYSIFSQYGYHDLMIRVYQEKNNYDRIYISRHFNDTKQYIYYLFYNKYDPAKYQKKVDVLYSQEANGWISIDKIENIYFVQNPPSIIDNPTLSGKKVLVISNPVDFPKAVRPVFLIKDKLGNVLFKAVIYSDLLSYYSKK